MNIEAIIKEAKLGRERKDAQVDTCTVFAAALFDVLTSHGIACTLATAVPTDLPRWAHAVVAVAGTYYDSMGEFSADIYRARAKIHSSVSFDIAYQPDHREDYFDSEFDGLYEFFVTMLQKAISRQAA